MRIGLSPAGCFWLGYFSALVAGGLAWRFFA